jgi:hypothetical protein
MMGPSTREAGAISYGPILRFSRPASKTSARASRKLHLLPQRSRREKSGSPFPLHELGGSVCHSLRSRGKTGYIRFRRCRQMRILFGTLTAPNIKRGRPEIQKGPVGVESGQFLCVTRAGKLEGWSDVSVVESINIASLTERSPT